MNPPKNDKARKEWLASLKDGEEVVVIGESKMSTTKVSRCKYHPEFTDDQRRTFTLASGKEVGKNCWLVPLTEEHKRQIQRTQLFASARSRMNRVGFMPWSCLDVKATDEQALACAAIMWPEEFGGKS